MKKLLVAYDGAPCSDNIIDDLGLAGLPSQLDVRVLSVADVYLPPEPAKVEAGFADRLPKRARDARGRALQELEVSRSFAERAATRLQTLFPSWHVEAQALADSPAWGIVKESVAHESELVVVGSHGRSPVGRFILGSVAHKVAAEARCSVRIARYRIDRTDGPPKILIGVDGSLEAELAVRAVAARSWQPGTCFRLITVVDPKLETYSAWPAINPELWPIGTNVAAMDWVSGLMEKSQQSLLAAKLHVDTDIFDGDPKQVLLRETEAWDADCVFLGARGLNHGDRVFLGSCASAVAARAHCSVEIIRS